MAMQWRESWYAGALRNAPWLQQWPGATHALIGLIDALCLAAALLLLYLVLLTQGLGAASVAAGGRPLSRLELWVLAPWFGLGSVSLLVLLLALGWLARRSAHETPE